MMALPWVCVNRSDGPAISLNNQVYDQIIPRAQHRVYNPSLVLFVGKREKQRVLNHILA
jgi:hypothetical protein